MISSAAHPRWPPSDQISLSLFQKNDKEKEYLKLSQAHKAQQDLLHRLQEKTQKEAKMKEAFKKQEQVIEKMENMLKDKQKGKEKDPASRFGNFLVISMPI
jgi:hypothetical protein